MRGALFENYEPLRGPDELLDASGRPREAYQDLAEKLAGWSSGDYLDRQARADLALRNSGITFTVYADEAGTERVFPFSLIPRIVTASEWSHVEAGLTQRGLGKRLQKPQSWVYNCESANRRVDVTEFIAWVRACGMDPGAAFARFLKSP